MEYIYAVMLLNKAGKDLTADNVTTVLSAAGVEADAAKVKSLIAALDGVDIQKVIEESSVAVATGPATAAVASGSESAPAQEVKEEKKEEPEVDASAGLGSLF